MIEAVNSTLANASVLRASAEQASASRLAQSVQVVLPEADIQLPQAPYISPYISVDLNYDKAVLQIRDSETGDVVQQFPTESRLAEIRRAKVALETRQLTSAAPQAQARAPQQTQSVSSQPTQDVQAAPKQAAPSQAPTVQVSAQVITVQEATAAPASNVSAAPSQAAVAALSAGAQSSGATSSVSVLA